MEKLERMTIKDIPKDTKILRASPTSKRILENYSKSTDSKIEDVFNIKIVCRNGNYVKTNPALAEFEYIILKAMKELGGTEYKVIEYDLNDDMVIVGFKIFIDDKLYLYCFGHRSPKIIDCLIQIK